MGAGSGQLRASEGWEAVAFRPVSLSGGVACVSCKEKEQA